MNNLAPLPVVVPLAAAAFILFMSTVLSRRAVQLLTASCVVGEIGLSGTLLYQARALNIVYWFGGWRPRAGVAFGVSFTIDQIGAGAAVLSGVVVGIALLTVPRTIRTPNGIVHAMLLTLLAAMAGFCLTGDLFNMFVFFELMAVCAFALAAYHNDSAASLRSALNFAITNSVGAFLVLIAIAMLYSRTGALNLAQIGTSLAGRHADRLVVVALALLLVGFLIKAAVMPFHFWLVDTVSSAPIPLVIVLAGALDVLGVYGVSRIYWSVFAGTLATDSAGVQTLLISLGAFSALIAAVLGLFFESPRRRLAFVMVAHTGIVLIGIGCLSAAGVAAASVYAAADGMVKIALFLGLLLLAGANAGRRAGLMVLGLGGLATAGLPVFATGLGKATIEDAAGHAGYAWAAVVVVVAAVFTGATVFDIASASRRAPPDAPEHQKKSAWVPLAIGGTFCLAASVALTSARRGFASAAARFVDTFDYQQRVLTGTAVHHANQTPVLALAPRGVAIDVAVVLAAIAVASLLPALRRVQPARGIARASNVAHRLHAGSIGDSATWVTVGTATIMAVLLAQFR